MRVLVTGGTGFIGSHLVDELLKQGYDVRMLRRQTSDVTLFEEKKNLSFVVGDLTDKNSLVRACEKIKMVFHVAALPRDWGPRKTFFEMNFDGTRNLLDACVINKVPRFVFMSSAAVYGFPKTQQLIVEGYEKLPTAKYGESKLYAEGLLWGYGLKHDIIVSAVRSPLVIGPRDRLISVFLINALRQGRLFYIEDGNQKISITDGRDVAHCLRLVGESARARNQVYNVKSFDSTPKQMMETLAERLGYPAPQTHRSYLGAYAFAGMIEGLWMLHQKQNPPITRHKVKVLGHSRVLDITKAQQELNYTPRYTLKATIDDVVTWYQMFIKDSSIKT